MGAFASRRVSRGASLSATQSVLLAVVALCAACMLAVCPAWAADVPQEEGQPASAVTGADAVPVATAASTPTATLTIISSTAGADSATFDQDGATVWVNKDYAIQGGDTVESLLNAAVKEKDLDAVDIQSGAYGPWINSITSTQGVCLDNGPTVIDGAGAYLYWSVFDNGGYASVGIGDLVVRNGGAYQLVWLASTYDSASGSAVYHTGAPITPQGWDGFYALNVPDPATADAADDPVTPAPAQRPANTEGLHGIMTGIIDSMTGTSDPWQAMDLAALGMTGKVDREALLKEGLAAIKAAGANSTIAQKYIIALTALGYDATRLPDGDATYDAIAAMAQGVHTGSLLNVRLATLWAYASGNYVAPGYPSISQLIDSIIADQLADGGFAISGSAADADMTAMAVNALAPYAKNSAAAQNALNAALSALKALQGQSGAWADKDGIENSNSTAFAIIALCAAGIDPARDWASSTGVTPLDALLGFALADGSGFAYSRGGELNAMSTEQALRALVAYRGLVAQQGAFNIYADAAKGIATIPAAASVQLVGLPAAASGPARTGDAGATLASLALAFLALSLAGARHARVARRSCD